MDRKISTRVVERKKADRRISEDIARDRGAIRIRDRYSGDRWGPCTRILWGGTQRFASESGKRFEKYHGKRDIAADSGVTERIVGS
jgi:hypothetical protein